MSPRIGSLFSGYGGLDMGVRAALGGSVAWHVENEPAAAKVLAHHWPTVPNHGDVTAVEWPEVEPVDVLTGGFPCQDVSAAGKRAGLMPDSRSGLWAHMARAVHMTRPRLVVVENVRGLLSAEAYCDLEPCPWCVGDGGGKPLRALGAVLGDLAVLGYDAVWCGLRAADVGAPHARYRVFVVATDAERDGWHGRRESAESSSRSPDQVNRLGERSTHANPDGFDARAVATRDRRGQSETTPRNRGGVTADTASDGRQQGWTQSSGIVGRSHVALGRGATTDTDDSGRERNEGASRRGEVGRVATDGSGASRLGGEHIATADADGDRREVVERTESGVGTRRNSDRCGSLGWGDYAPAVERWAAIVGRDAPSPTRTGRRGGQQLAPEFVEWLMGLDAGHVTGVDGLTRNDRLRLLGNGVVPQQAAVAVAWLVEQGGAA